MLPDLKYWLGYFEANEVAPDGIAWDIMTELTEDERTRIVNSIAKFQLGEYSEGRGLMKFARTFANNMDSEELVLITKLFVKEEQNHADLLRKFMVRQQIPIIRNNWTDTVFRRLRKNVGYELSITVLITAEIIALVYYQALQACTEVALLKQICDKILKDERAHVTYESDLITFIQGQHGEVRRVMTRLAHRFLFLGTVVVVYLDHASVLNQGGFGPKEFWSACWDEFNVCFGRV